LKGKNCALLSIVYIGWTLIGYCGAHHQKFSFLLIYSALVVLYVFSNIVVVGVLAPKFQWLDANLVWIMCGYFSVLMVCALLLAYQIRLKDDTNRYGNQMSQYYTSGSRFASLRRMGSLRAGYGRHLSRLFGSNGDANQAGPSTLIAVGNEFGPIYTQHQQPTYCAPMPPNGAQMQMSHRSQAGPLSPSPQIAAQLNSSAIGPPSYQSYGPYHSPYMQGGPAVPMEPPAYGGNYLGRQWQRMSAKRSSLRSSSAAYGNGSTAQYNTCELKNLGPGRVNFL
jgi:hypothetical protein